MQIPYNGHLTESKSPMAVLTQPGNVLMCCFSQAMERQPTECMPESMDSEDDLFVMFTSGLTGEPKGIVHTQAGYLLHVAVTHKV